MPSEADRFLRALDNLYSAVFERRPRQLDRRQIHTTASRETINVDEESVTLEFVPSALRAYADLNLARGSTGAGAQYALDDTRRVRYGSGVMDRDVGGMTIRFRPQFLSTATGEKFMFSWRRVS